MDFVALAKENNWSEAQSNAFSGAYLAAVKNSTEQDAIVKAVEAAEKVNASDFPKFFYARHMQPGLAGYNDETLLVSGDAMKSMAASMAGKPVYINHQSVDLSNIKQEASGYVAESFYNELDGWLWAKMLLVDDEAKKCAMSGAWGVSNAYVPKDWTGPGTENNMPYTRAITSADFTHLAIVDNPRYEQAKIYNPEAFRVYQDGKRQQLNELKNSKETKEKAKPMFEFFKNKTERVPATEVDAETMLEVKNDKGEVTGTHKVADMVAAVLNAAKAKKNADEDDNKEKMNEATMVKVGDEEMTYGELVNRFTKANSESEDDKKDGAKENSKDTTEEQRIAAAVKIALETAGHKNFDEIANANKGGGDERLVTVDMPSNKLARGKSQYGSGK